MTTRIFGLLLLVLGTVSGKAGPNTAVRATLQDSPFTVSLAGGARCCPPSFSVQLTRDLPNPGWTMKVDRVVHERDTMRITVDVTLTPSTGMQPQVIAKRSATAQLGSLRKGRWVVQIRTRRGAGAYQLEQAEIVAGS